MAIQVVTITLSDEQFEEKVDSIAEAAINRVFLRYLPQLLGSTLTEPRYYSRKETAKKLGVTLPTLHTWTQEGRIEARRIGSRVLYTGESIDQALQKIKTSISAAA